MEHSLYTPLTTIDTKQQSVKCKLTSSKNCIFDFSNFAFLFFFFHLFQIKNLTLGPPSYVSTQTIYTQTYLYYTHHPLRMPANALLNNRSDGGMTMTDLKKGIRKELAQRVYTAMYKSRGF